MTKYRPEQTTFGAGELSPSLRGRSDVPEFRSGCLTLENSIATRFGGQFKRWGTRFEEAIVDAGNGSAGFYAPSRLIPWVVPGRGSFILVLRNDGKFHLYDAVAGAFVEATDPPGNGANFGVHHWGASDSVFTVHYTIQGGKVYFSGTDDGVEPAVAEYNRADVQPTAIPVTFRLHLEGSQSGAFPGLQTAGPRSGGRNRSVSLELFDITASTQIPSVVANKNFFPKQIDAQDIDHNTIWRVDGTYVQTLGRASKKILAVKLLHGPRSSTGPTLDWSGPWVKKTTIGGAELAETWDLTEIEPGVPITVGSKAKLSATGTVSTSVNLVGQILAPYSSVNGDDEWDHFFLVTKRITDEEYEVLVLYRLDGDVQWTQNCRRWGVEPQPDLAARVALTPSDVEGTITVTSSDPFFTSDMGVVFGTSAARIWLNGGLIELTTMVGTQTYNATVMERLDSTNPTTGWEVSWSRETGYPRAITSHQRRLVYGFDNTAHGSRSGSPDDWEKGVEADDPYEFEIVTDEQQNIAWLMSSTSLLVGTEYGEVTGDGQPLSPTSLNFNRQTAYGCGRIMPQQMVNSAVFTNQLRRAVRLMSLRENVARFEGPDLSDTAEHLFATDTIREFSYGRGDQDILYVVGDSGQLSTCTYRPENGVKSWCVWRGLTVRSATRLTFPDRDVVYFSVEREVNGQTVHYLESVDCGCNLMDSHVVTDAPPTSVISGLDHLEGEEVQVWADDEDFGNRTVSGGQIDIGPLDELPARVVVGLAYDWLFQPQRIPVISGSGSTSGEEHTVVRLLALFKDVDGVEVKSREGDFVDLESAYAEDSGEEPDWQDIYGVSAHEGDEMPILRQRSPLPVEILAVKPSIETADS